MKLYFGIGFTDMELFHLLAHLYIMMLCAVISGPLKTGALFRTLIELEKIFKDLSFPNQ